MQLGKNIKAVRVASAAAAGTTAVNSTVLDMQGHGAVLFLIAFGAITAGAVTSVKVQHGAAADGSDMADVAGSSVAVADTADNQLVALEVLEPTKRYLRVVVSRATQTSAVDGITALQYASKTYPPALDATAPSFKAVLGPQSGVA